MWFIAGPVAIANSGNGENAKESLATSFDHDAISIYAAIVTTVGDDDATGIGVGVFVFPLVSVFSHHDYDGGGDDGSGGGSDSGSSNGSKVTKAVIRRRRVVSISRN